MTYDTFITIIEKTSRVKLIDAIEVLSNLYSLAKESNDSIDEYNKIFDLINMMLQKNNFVGNNSDFHNIAVTCAIEEDYDASCIFLDYGLKKYPYDIDLLSDYLKYGMQCNKFEKCNDAYEKLLKRKKEWNWRAYRFSIDYLIDLTNVDFIDRTDTIKKLIKEFQNNLPCEENAYLVEAEYYYEKSQNNFEKNYVSILEYATSDKSPVAKTPKCDLKLASYYYSNGNNILKAIELLERSKKDSIDLQKTVNRTYIFLLLTLCKISLYYEQKQKNGTKGSKKLINEIYDIYHIAALDSNDYRVSECKKIIETFARETKVPYPYDDIENNIY